MAMLFNQSTTTSTEIAPYCNICKASKGHYTWQHNDWAKIK